MTDSDWTNLGLLLLKAEEWSHRKTRSRRNPRIESSDMIRVAMQAVDMDDALENFIATFSHEFIVTDGFLPSNRANNE